MLHWRLVGAERIELPTYWSQTNRATAALRSEDGVAKRVRTSDPRFRKPLLCPTELQRRKMERAMGFEPTTSSLEGWRSTAELHPQNGSPTGTSTRTSGLLPGILFTRPLLALGLA